MSSPGTHLLSLNTPSFYILVATLGLFVLMLLLLRSSYPRRRRAFAGYFDAAGVSLAFLLFSVGLVVALAVRDPHAGRFDYALFQTVLAGYWLTFAIPVVTVASSVEARSRGAIRWLWPSIGLTAVAFLAFCAYYYAV